MSSSPLHRHPPPLPAGLSATITAERQRTNPHLVHRLGHLPLAAALTTGKVGDMTPRVQAQRPPVHPPHHPAALAHQSVIPDLTYFTLLPTMREHDASAPGRGKRRRRDGMAVEGGARTTEAKNAEFATRTRVRTHHSHHSHGGAAAAPPDPHASHSSKRFTSSSRPCKCNRRRGCCAATLQSAPPPRGVPAAPTLTTHRTGCQMPAWRAHFSARRCCSGASRTSPSRSNASAPPSPPCTATCACWC